MYQSMLHGLRGSIYLDGLYAFYNRRVFAGMPGNVGNTTDAATESGEDYAGLVAEALLAMQLVDSTSKFHVYYLNYWFLIITSKLHPHRRQMQLNLPLMHLSHLPPLTLRTTQVCTFNHLFTSL